MLQKVAKGQCCSTRPNAFFLFEKNGDRVDFMICMHPCREKIHPPTHSPPHSDFMKDSLENIGSSFTALFKALFIQCELP